MVPLNAAIRTHDRDVCTFASTALVPGRLFSDCSDRRRLSDFFFQTHQKFSSGCQSLVANAKKFE
jgi:hypothetical protein